MHDLADVLHRLTVLGFPDLRGLEDAQASALRLSFQASQRSPKAEGLIPPELEPLGDDGGREREDGGSVGGDAR
jgi:hypothetical protein